MLIEQLGKQFEDTQPPYQSEEPGLRHFRQALYDILVAPVIYGLGSLRYRDLALCFVESHVLPELPFHALANERGRSLICDFPVSYAISIRQLCDCLRAPIESNDCLVVGTDSSIRADIEVSWVSAALGGKGRKVRTITSAQEAAEELLSGRSFHVVHVASHGVESGDDEGTYLDLGGIRVNQRDWLTSGVRGDLVFLNACSLATGLTCAPGERIGMVSSILSRGTRACVAASTPIFSEAAREFGIKTASAIRNGSDPAMAAVRTMRDFTRPGGAWCHPRFWSPYFVYGLSATLS
ncbi:MAG: CHAT domain-containing protein [Verrucomicrobiaceae bacterium]|nr:MAG: CHAT domain-containing protein [Verrucomicrobiaceae bacterium]